MRKNEMFLPSPLELVSTDQLEYFNGHEIWVKRDDLIHPQISGNKYRKLKYNITPETQGVITFGGAFSNHILATAAYCKHLNIPCIGIIRGEEAETNNPTLQQAAVLGMAIYPVERSEYRKKEASNVIQKFLDLHPDWTLIPEGGTNENALKGCEEIVDEIFDQLIPDYIFCAVGTGGTASGILKSLKTKNVATKLVAVSCLKADYLKDEIVKYSGVELQDFIFIGDQHKGGYAKVDSPIIDFIHTFYDQTSLKLDPIYNAKVVMALMEWAHNRMFKPNSKIVWVHTGGMQGVDGHNYMVRMGKIKHVGEIKFP